jgi:hypothetical protein
VFEGSSVFHRANSVKFPDVTPPLGLFASGNRLPAFVQMRIKYYEDGEDDDEDSLNPALKLRKILDLLEDNRLDGNRPPMH